MDAPSDLGSPGAAPTPPPPEGRPGPRRLRRRPDDGHIAGVCAGVAEYFNVDPVHRPHRRRRAAVQRPRRLRLRPRLDLRPRRARARPLRRATASDRQEGPGHPDLRDRAAVPRRERDLGRLVGPCPGLAVPLGLIALGAWLVLRPDREDDDLPPVPPAPPGAAGTTDAGMGLGPRHDHRPTAVQEGDRRRPTDDASRTSDGRCPTEGRRHDHRPAHHRAGDAGGGTGPPPPSAPWDVPPPPVPGEPLARGPRPPTAQPAPPAPPPRRSWRVRRAAHLDRRRLAHRGGPDDRARRGSGDPRPGLRARVLRRWLPRADLPRPRGGPRCSRSPRSSTSPSPAPSESSTGRRISRAELDQVDTYEVSMGEGTLDLSELAAAGRRDRRAGHRRPRPPRRARARGPGPGR